MLDLAAQAGLNTIRIVNFIDEQGDPAVAPYRESDWRRVDRIIDELRKRDMKAILDLSTFRNCLQNWGVAHGGTVTPYSQDWSPFVDFVLRCRNTVDHRPYSSDPAIAMVSFAGEPNPPGSGEPLRPTTAELTSFYARVFAHWRGHDRNHLLSAGGFIHLDWEERFGNKKGSGIDWRAIFALRDNDVPAIHTYPDPIDRAHEYQSPKVAAYCTSIGKPWLTEEFGISQYHADSERAYWYSTVYEIQADLGSAGASFWNLGPELTPAGQADPTTYDTNPSTPLTWAAVQAAAP
jgi:mannan endo-1,4-beta-mannosidase